MSNSAPTYDVFLSYNSLDHAVVERVAKALDERNCSYFIDRWYLQPGQDWVAALERALAGSRSVAVFVGPHEMGRWQQRERAWALDRQAGDDDYRVIPVLLPGCEPPLGFLAQLMWIDLRDNPADAVQFDALAAAIRGESVDRTGRPEPRVTICPYRGLLAFREEDASFFFGRETYTERLVEMVRKQPLVAVIGASGSGKSSVVRAGLVPRLRRDGDGPVWDILTMLPREDPLHSLADVFLPLIEPELSGIDFIKKRKSLAEDLEQAELSLTDLVGEALKQQPGTDRLLLLVDQWEELYTQCEDANQRARFIDELLDATARKQSVLSVVLTVRSGFYSQLQQHRELLDRLHAGKLDLGPMNRAELFAAIDGPANVQGVGLTFQDGLVKLIRDDAIEEPGRLALLEFALEELWKRRDHGQLTLEAYQDLGRISGAIATRAEQIYKDLDESEQAVMPGLFRRLVQAGEKTEDDTRRRAELADLDATSLAVVRKLVDERLLVTTGDQPAMGADGTNGPTDTDVGGQETVEVAHEELLRQWGRLKKWINEDRQFLQWRSRLGPLREEFERDLSALLRGEALRQSSQYVPSRADELGAAEHRFVVASQQAGRRRKQFVGTAVVVVVLLTILGGWGWQRSSQQQRADELVEGLLATPAGGVEYYLEGLNEYQHLAIKGLTVAFEDEHRPRAQRLHAAYALLHFDAAGQAEAEFVLDNVPRLPGDESANIVRALEAVPDRLPDRQRLLRQYLDQATGPERVRYLAVAIGLGFSEEAAVAARLKADPTDRTMMIREFKEFPGDLGRLAQVLEKTEDNDLRSALCLAIGRLGTSATEATGETLEHLFTNAQDGGTHSAAAWALRQQGCVETELSEMLTAQQAERWYVIRFEKAPDMTMVMVPGHQFAMGRVDDDENPGDDDEPVSFDGFWMSDREVTVGQFQKFVDATQNEIGWTGAAEGFSPADDHPVQQVSWFDAIDFCNWLTDMENELRVEGGLERWQHRYKIDGDTIERNDNGRITRADVTEGNGHGYRLPSEAEWEYACRALSTTDFCFGDDESLLDDYAVWRTDQTAVCGSRLPNGWGLFDMHGNVWERCSDRYGARKQYRVLRGGSFYDYMPRDLRSATHSGTSPGSGNYDFGFRVSRTP